MIRFSFVDPSFLDRAWLDALPFVESACRRGGFGLTVDEVQDICRTHGRLMLIHRGNELVGAGSLERYNDGLFVVTMGWNGLDADELEALNSHVKGLTRGTVSAIGRRGWRRFLLKYGWKATPEGVELQGA